MTDATLNIIIEDDIAIPTRELVGRPRGSQYPLEKMTEGQSFALRIDGVEGSQRERKDGTKETLTAAQDQERKARQKQSYFSALGAKLGIAVVTRWFPEAGVLRVWHAGPAKEKPKRTRKAKDNPVAPGPVPGPTPPAETEDGSLNLDI